MQDYDRYTRMSIQASDRPNALCEYAVTGRGQFPADMLRYDLAWPADGDSAAAIVAAGPDADRRSVRLRSYARPTIARWASFGWSVSKEPL